MTSPLQGLNCLIHKCECRDDRGDEVRNQTFSELLEFEKNSDVLFGG
jgi:hypothetical protein